MLTLYQTCLRVQAKILSLALRRSFSSFGKRSVIQPPCRLKGADRIDIASNVTIGPHSWLQVLAGPDDQRGRISIGRGTSIAGFLTVSAVQSVIVEENVLIARYVYLSDHSHRFDDPTLPIKDQGVSKIAPVCIKRGAWLGQGVVVCPGVTVGVNAVVGANSVVRQDIPDHAVAAGAPARVIRAVDR